MEELSRQTTSDRPEMENCILTKEDASITEQISELHRVLIAHDKFISTLLKRIDELSAIITQIQTKIG